jgi:hypothetical protein
VRTFLGWATCAFAVAKSDRVAYLYMPKAGSTTIRNRLKHAYGLRGSEGFPGGIHPNDTYIALPIVALPKAFALWFYQGRFVSDPGAEGGLRSVQSVSSLDGFYRFTFVVDPVDHLIRGVCQTLSSRFHARNPCLRAVQTGQMSRKLREEFAAAVQQISTALHSHAKAKFKVNMHLAPQLWLLRAVVKCTGRPLDFVANFNSSTWDELNRDMARRGYRPPGSLSMLSASAASVTSELKNQNSFSSLTAMVFRAASPETVRMACETVAGEYAAFGLPPRVDGICAEPAAP